MLPSNVNKPSLIITANSVYFHVRFPETLLNRTRLRLTSGGKTPKEFYRFWGEKVRAASDVLSFTSLLGFGRYPSVVTKEMLLVHQMRACGHNLRSDEQQVPELVKGETIGIQTLCRI